MRIVDVNYKWNGVLVGRQETKYIILHHRAGLGDAESIHYDHLNRGWSGIGYHFYVRRDGTVYRGRPITKTGAHTEGYNIVSVGVCFEGNYEADIMPEAQVKAGQEIVSWLTELYPNAKVCYHKDFAATSCPGKNFPDKIKKGAEKMTVDEAVEIIQYKIGLEDQTIDFLLCYKYGEELVIKIAEAIK